MPKTMDLGLLIVISNPWIQRNDIPAQKNLSLLTIWNSYIDTTPGTSKY